MHGVCDHRVHWVPGHHGFLPNEKVDELVKKAAKGETSHRRDLPTFFRESITTSVAASHQENKDKIQHLWKRCWKHSPCQQQIEKIDKFTLSKKWVTLTKQLTHKQASIIQPCTSHIGLNKLLHHIKHTVSPKCPDCNEETDKTVHHYLLTCTHYRCEHFILHRSLCCHSSELSYLLSNPAVTFSLLKYIQAITISNKPSAQSSLFHHQSPILHPADIQPLATPHLSMHHPQPPTSPYFSHTR